LLLLDLANVLLVLGAGVLPELSRFVVLLDFRLLCFLVDEGLDHLLEVVDPQFLGFDLLLLELKLGVFGLNNRLQS